MSSNLGTSLKLSVFGQSHGRAIGLTMDGLPSGEVIDLVELQSFLDRRRPGTSGATTARKEADRPEFLSGVVETGENEVTTCGFPLAAVIYNSDQRSSDYEDLRTNPRPSHADYTAYVKYGDARDMRGGGHFSGRLTAPLCIAGGICRQILARRGIFVGAHLQRVGDVYDEPFPAEPSKELLEEVAGRSPAVLSEDSGKKMLEEIYNARMDSDSVGGVIECVVTGMPAGVGGPMFDGVENELAKALFGIPAVKGVEFGNGFDAASLRGSENNDAFTVRDGKVCTETNRSGGIQGGITNGMPVLFRVAVKPTPSIARPQKTVDLTTMEETELVINGRHDPCIALRAVPVVEAVAAVVITDLLLGERKLEDQ